MERKVFFSNTSPAVKLFILLVAFLMAMFIFSAAGILSGVLFYGKDLSSILATVSHPQSEADRSFLYLFQLINQIGVFFLLPFLFAYLFSNNSKLYLRLNNPSLPFIIAAGIIIFTILPFINWIGDINQQMSFPDWLSGVGEWMKAKENQADKLTLFFLSVSNVKGLFLNILIIGLIPALGEELLFRGLLQRLFNEWTRHVPLGVILTAFVFSAIHLQFFGFLPRFVLGLILGTLLEITQSLWVPVFSHFVNNTTLVVLYYLHNKGLITIEPEHFGSMHHFFPVLLSLLFTLALLVWMAQKQKKRKTTF
ncbi:CPBP family intramembrane metalloprotease [Candidatus Sulfidibacterium hydrothermale]|uniref:CPBP family intramembrane glutamic endopeptidase n=1 Tax=Candidatus Sulfidibacterium hydrothermale TaxID=2875962 RepID=UPI001F0B455A|nr:CPBP family intramembrane glutamic endopeptidase [Candidatus Sulfidibacterium hydrothermale]UBM62432.1 CPBP family intramembrane metalloprotease [Candidatus Sulfidibacterium hydrothermale]